MSNQEAVEASLSMNDLFDVWYLRADDEGQLLALVSMLNPKTDGECQEEEDKEGCQDADNS